MANKYSPNQPGSGAKSKYKSKKKKQQEIIDLGKLNKKLVDAEIIAASLTEIPSPSGIDPSSQQLRYPASPNITEDTDYVMFQFYNYKPPFQNRAYKNKFANTGTKLTKDQSEKIIKSNDLNTINVRDYNDQAELEKAEDYKNIILYMPEDISTGFKSNWGGKNLTNFASGVLQSAGADGFDKIKNSAQTLADAFGNVSYMAGASVIRKFVQATGGDSISNDDVFGAISGAILNPNTELLFSGVDMRNFQLNFKLVPRDANEAAMVNSIVAHFKKASLPSRVPNKIFGNTGGVKKNFIGVPKLVRVNFMSGDGEHPQLPKFKVCALTQVDVNYTPDGVYATYESGQPVAMTMTLNFQETKIVFADEVDADGIGGIR